MDPFQELESPLSGHTPGPWTVQEGKTLLHIETANMGDGKPCGMAVCSVPKKRRIDAMLIAEAPTLLAERDALKAALEQMLLQFRPFARGGTHSYLDPAISQAEAAIRKTP